MGGKEQLMSVCATLAKLKRICHFLSALLSRALNPLAGGRDESTIRGPRLQDAIGALEPASGLIHTSDPPQAVNRVVRAQASEQIIPVESKAGDVAGSARVRKLRCVIDWILDCR